MIAFKIYGHFGMERCTNNKILLVKILKNEIFYKINRFLLFLLKFLHNTHFDSKNMSKELNFKIFKFGPPTKKNFKVPQISQSFGPKFSNWDFLILFHTWNLLTFKIYKCGTFLQKIDMKSKRIWREWAYRKRSYRWFDDRGDELTPSQPTKCGRAKKGAVANITYLKCFLRKQIRLSLLFRWSLF